MRTLLALLVTATVAAGAGPAFAQSEPRFAASGAIGLDAGSAQAGVVAGGSLLFDVHERVSIEGQALYLARGSGADGLTAGGSVLFNFLPASESLVPYAAIGGGVYHVSFDLADPRFLGPVNAQFGPGSTLCAAPGTGFGFGPGPGFGGTGDCPAAAAGYWGVGDLPVFYARRLGALAFPQGGAWGSRTFTDPAVNVGGGLRFNINEQLMIRPDARAIVVFRDGHTHTLGVFTVHIGYRF